MKDKIEGLVISETSYSETSKIINVLTKDGIVGILAKGAKNIKSNLRVGTTKITLGSFILIPKQDNLSILTSVDTIDEFKNIKKNITKISYATYLIELAKQVMKHNINENIYNLLISSLKKINEGYDEVVITNILELKYLDYLGVMPVLDECSICGSKMVKTLSPTRGGLVCKNCIKDEKIVDEKTIKLIRMLYYVDIDKIDKLNINSKYKKEISDFLDEYYETYTGLYLHSKALLKNVNKVN